jgi:hypothetical protein
MESEDLAEDRVVVLLRLIEVEPEELSPLEARFDLAAIRRDGRRTVVRDEVRAQFRCFSRTRAFLPTFPRR